jgi:CBS domain-containing protein
MQVSEVMTRDVKVADPSMTIEAAARIMQEIDAGFLPVGDQDRLVGTITDRDIAIRAVGRGMGPETRVGDVMTKDVKYCFEDEDITGVAANMADIQVRRLPVVNRDKRLVGVLSLGDIAIETATQREAEHALSGISEPSHPPMH